MATLVRPIERMRQSVGPFVRFFNGPFADMSLDPAVANFAVGNPQEMPIPAYVDALRTHLTPRDKDWFAYKQSEPRARAAVARSLSARTGIDWDPADVAMTNGGFAALAVALRAVLDPGDEVVFLTPPWFFYELLILAAGGEPVRVRLPAPGFEVDPTAIGAAISPRTRAVLLNSPHNPGGRVVPIETLRALGDTLESASRRAGRPIFLISDEPYNRIVFDGRQFHSPAEVYPRTITTYSYGKTLLAPGMRIGYLTVPPTMPDRDEFRDVVFVAQFATGYAFPNALLQHAIEDLERLSIDVGALERRRNRLVPALRALGYETTMPEGTFYVMVRAPIADDLAFADVLARHRILVLPGTVAEAPGWFRLSLTASDSMVSSALPGFAAALDEVSRGRFRQGARPGRPTRPTPGGTRAARR